MKNVLIFDAGPLINFAMNGLLDVLIPLKKKFNGSFLITKEVKTEIIDRPLTIRKYELEALRIQEFFTQGVISYADLSESQVDELRQIRDGFLQTANSLFFTRRGSIHLLDKGEAAALALSVILSRETKRPVPLVIDEKTARMLCENPENLRKLLEKKFHESIKVNIKQYNLFKSFKIIRSTELIYLAFQNKFVTFNDSRTLEALLYALKYHGCSITDGEIEEMKLLAK